MANKSWIAYLFGGPGSSKWADNWISFVKKNGVVVINEKEKISASERRNKSDRRQRDRERSKTED